MITVPFCAQAQGDCVFSVPFLSFFPVRLPAETGKKEETYMKLKRLGALLLSASLMLAALTACGSKPAANDTAEDTKGADAAATDTAADDEENYETGDASLDNPLNQDEIGENELLVVSFGTSYNDSRRETIGAIEAAMQKAFPDYSVRRGFTSQIIIDHVNKRDGEKIDNVTEALDRAVANGVKNLVVQPTHLMNGLEYTDLKNELAGYDFQKVMNAIVDATKEYDDGETAICFMGHGTEADSNSVYTKMQETLTAAGHTNYFVGTVEATPSLDDVIAAVKESGFKKVVLRPLMIVAGDHANNDMAGDEDGSWKTEFEKAGFEVTTVVEGLGGLTDIQNLFVAHAQAAVDSLK